MMSLAIAWASPFPCSIVAIVAAGMLRALHEHPHDLGASEDGAADMKRAIVMPRLQESAFEVIEVEIVLDVANAVLVLPHGAVPVLARVDAAVRPLPTSITHGSKGGVGDPVHQPATFVAARPEFCGECAMWTEPDHADRA